MLAVAPGFAVAVKLNRLTSSAVFQCRRCPPGRDDAQRTGRGPGGVVCGSYEHSVAMQGEARDGCTLAREAHFVEFARDIRTVAKMPIMVTGMRRLPVAEQVVRW